MSDAFVPPEMNHEALGAACLIKLSGTPPRSSTASATC